MNTTSSTAKIRMIVFNALFIALILVMQITGIGLIRLGVINITFYCTVVAVGTLFLGLKSGLIQGFAFGTISLIAAIQSPSGLVSPILSNSVLQVALMCYIPRLLVPVATHFVHKLFLKDTKDDRNALIWGGAAGSLTNTVLYLGIMILCYVPMMAQHPTVLATIGGIVLYGGIPEAIVAGVLTPALVTALRKAAH